MSRLPVRLWTPALLWISSARWLSRPVPLERLPSWALPLMRWPVIATVTVLALAAIGAQGWWVLAQRAELQLLSRQLSERAAASFAALASEDVTEVPPSDFTSRLPVVADVAGAMIRLQRSVAANGVLLMDIQSQITPPSEQQLGQNELNLQLRGGYAASKNVVRDMLTDQPYVTVRRLAMRRGSAGTDVETQLTLVLWSRPLPTAVGGSDESGVR